MKRNKVTITDDLIQDLNSYSSSICASLAAQTRDELTEAARDAILAFYNHYRPKNGEPLYYKRHYDNFLENSFRKYYKNPHNSIARGGVELTPYSLDDLYRADTEYIFNLVYLGYHGNVGMLPHQINNVPPVMTPDPLTMILNRRDYIVDNMNKYEDEAFKKAEKKSYSTFILK